MLYGQPTMTVKRRTNNQSIKETCNRIREKGKLGLYNINQLCDIYGKSISCVRSYLTSNRGCKESERSTREKIHIRKNKTDRQSTIIKMMVLLGYSYRDISKIINLNHRYIYTLYHRQVNTHYDFVLFVELKESLLSVENKVIKCGRYEIRNVEYNNDRVILTNNKKTVFVETNKLINNVDILNYE